MHYIDAPDYEDKGGGVRWFKETPLPGTVVGKHIQNAMMIEIIGVLNEAGIAVRASGAADEAGSWGQLRTAIKTLIDNNEIKTDLSSGNIVVKDDGDNILSISEVYGRIGYHKVHQIISLTLTFRVDVDTDTNYLKFEVPDDYRAYGASLSVHPLVKVACCEYTSDLVWSEFNNIYLNMESTTPPLANTFYIGNYQLVQGLPTVTVFPAVGGTGGYSFGINYIYRRAG